MAPTPSVMKTTYPRRDFAGITQVGLTALGLAQAHPAELDPRLPAGLLTGLGADLAAMGVVVPGAAQAHASARLATEERDAAVVRTIACVGAMRQAVRDADAPAEVQHAYGVGKTLDKRRLTVLRGVVGLIFDRLGAHPEDIAAFGFVQADIDALTARKADVEVASTAQQQKRAGAPSTTKERNRTANRILAAVKRIRGAGVLAFATDPVVRDEFAALRLGPRTKSAKAKTPAQPATPTNTASPQPATPPEPVPATPPAPPAP